jgi:hypothetical protein
MALRERRSAADVSAYPRFCWRAHSAASSRTTSLFLSALFPTSKILTFSTAFSRNSRTQYPADSKVRRLLRSNTTKAPIAFRNWLDEGLGYLVVTERNCSCPAVSQIWAFTVCCASMGIVLEEYSMPSVGPFGGPPTTPFTKLAIMLVLPTPESPRNTTVSPLEYACRRRGIPPAFKYQISFKCQNIKNRCFPHTVSCGSLDLSSDRGQ